MSTTRGIPEPPKTMRGKVKEEKSPVGRVAKSTAKAAVSGGRLRMVTAILVLVLVTSACASESGQGSEGFCEGIPADVPQVMQAPGSVWLNPPLDTVTAVTDWFASLPVSPNQQIQAGIDKLILDLEAAATGVSGSTESLSVSTGGITSLINEACGLNIGSVRMTFGT